MRWFSFRIENTAYGCIFAAVHKEINGYVPAMSHEYDFWQR